MGIKGLNDFLRKKCPEAFVEKVKSDFKHLKIAIDSNNILYKYKCRAFKEIVNKTDVCTVEINMEEVNKKYIYHVKNFLLGLLRNQSIPIFVFDGDHVPEKSGTQDKRREDKKKMVREAEELKEKIWSLDILERTPAMTTELRKKIQNLGTLTRDDKQQIIGILSAIGIPVLIANGEAEALCAMLCIEGKVDAVFSRDTDLVAFGCPLIINEEGGYKQNNYGEVEECYKCTIFKPILSKLNMEYSTFRDLCIMSGCDFNTNIYNLGIGRSYPLLLKCGQIEDLPEKYLINIDCLKHLRCREIFTHMPSQSVCQDDEIILDINTDLTDVRDRLEMYGAEDWLQDIIPIYDSFVQETKVIIPKPPTKARSTMVLNIVKTPTLNIVNTNSNNNNNNNNSNNLVKGSSVPIITSTVATQSSPKKLTTKRTANLNKSQLDRFNQRLNKI
jgi:flap endonuclease-1